MNTTIKIWMLRDFIGDFDVFYENVETPTTKIDKELSEKLQYDNKLVIKDNQHIPTIKDLYFIINNKHIHFNGFYNENKDIYLFLFSE